MWVLPFQVLLIGVYLFMGFAYRDRGVILLGFAYPVVIFSGSADRGSIFSGSAYWGVSGCIFSGFCLSGGYLFRSVVV